MTREQQIVYDIAKAGKVAKPELIVAQMMHESQNFTSHVYKANNNPMGMKMPSKRKSPYILGPGTKPPPKEGPTPYAKYASLGDSAKDLLHYLAFNKVTTPANIDSVEHYAEALRAYGYMGKSQSGKAIYVAGLNNNLKKLGATLQGGTKANKNGLGTIAGIFIVLLLASFLIK